MCYFLLYSKGNQPYVYIHALFFGFPSHLGCHRALSRAPCAIYSSFSLVIYFIYSTVYMEKAMATHSSTLGWKIPWVEEPGSLQSVGSRRVGHD